MKKIVCLLLTVIVLCGGFSVFASTPYETYTYDAWNRQVSIPATYYPEISVDLGDSTPFNSPSDMKTYDNKTFVLDTGNNRVVILDEEFKLIKEISTFYFNEKETALLNPEGLFISKTGELYICDTGNARILICDWDGVCRAVIEKPEVKVLSSDYTFLPKKIAVDDVGRIYIIASGINKGLMQIDEAGNFVSFVGAPPVSYNFFDYIWKRLTAFTESENYIKFVPTEYTNITIDEKNFLYVTSNPSQEDVINQKISSLNAVRRLNYSGTDVLKRNSTLPDNGDLFSAAAKSKGVKDSAFVGICVNSYGTYYCLDANNGKVFAYDDDGNLLYVFGGIGKQKGTFQTPIAIAELNQKILVLDKNNGNVTVFNLTEFGSMINEAVLLFQNGQYEESIEKWDEVLTKSYNYPMANIGKGKALYREGKHNQAREYLETAGELKYNSRAFSEYRDLIIMKLFPYLFALIAFVLIICLAFAIKKNIRKKR